MSADAAFRDGTARYDRRRVDYGAPACRIGDWVGRVGTVIDSSRATCFKPRFPDSTRANVGSYAVAFSPNGQCFDHSAGVGRGAFVTYNSQVNSISVSGAPSTSAVVLQV